jgi:Uma2 family endonuclease
MISKWEGPEVLMTRVAKVPPREVIEYPESDGRPMGETPLHFQNLVYVWQCLQDWFARQGRTAFVAGNMYMYYEPGNRYRSVVPDLFVALGISPRQPERRVFKTWEDKSPDLVIEVTSRSTSDEDGEDKFRLYRDTLKVREYFLFDPDAEYLDPPLQGFRLTEGQYAPLDRVEGRLPSEVLALHLEEAEGWLRLYDPVEGVWLPTPPEAVEQAEARALRAERARFEAERALQEEMQRAKTESERLRKEIEELRRRLPPGQA